MYITDRFEITKRDFSPEGYLIVKDSKLARTGVLNYRKSEIKITDAPKDIPDDQLVRVYRGPEELFRPEVLDSFKSTPITFNHPGELVDSTTIKDAGVGLSKDDVVAKGNFMEVTLFITDEDAIKEVRSGVKELSLGYTANIIWRPGKTPTGEVYDAVQENIRGNHIAIVPKGRNGSLCKISDSQSKTKTKGKDMSDVQIVLDSVSYDCPAQTAQAFEKTVKGKDSQISVLKDAKEAAEEELEDEKEKSQKEKDEMQAKLDEAEEAKVSDADIEKMVEARSALMDSAKSVVATIDCKGKSEAEIKAAVVKDSCPDLDLESKSPEYISARFDAILDTASSAPKKSAITDAMKDHAKGGTSEESTLLDSGMSLSEKTRLEKINKNRTKYRGA